MQITRLCQFSRCFKSCFNWHDVVKSRNEWLSNQYWLYYLRHHCLRCVTFVPCWVTDRWPPSSVIAECIYWHNIHARQHHSPCSNIDNYSPQQPQCSHTDMASKSPGLNPIEHLWNINKRLNQPRTLAENRHALYE